MSTPRPLTTAAALAGACDRLGRAPFLAVDTEFHRERTFYAQLLLIQIASPDEVVLLDPLALTDLGPLRALLMRTDIVKVFHSARQDLEILHDLWGDVPAPVFDTQVAATVLGLGHQIGYARLVESVLGVLLEKAGTLTDWSRRPLSATQLRYAADDVVHLAAMYPILAARLEEQGRGTWLQPEMTTLADPAQYRADPSSAWRGVRGGGTLRGPARSALRGLAAWREGLARAKNLPRRWVVGDETLLEIAKRRPADREELATIRGVSAKVLHEHADRIVAVVAASAEAGEPKETEAERTPPLRATPEAEALADLMQALVRLRARERGVSAGQLATREQLERVAMDGERADAGVLAGWRRELVGDDLLALRAGALRLVVRDGIVRVEQ